MGGGLVCRYRVVRGTLEIGDVAPAALPGDGAVIERKTAANFYACLGRE